MTHLSSANQTQETSNYSPSFTCRPLRTAQDLLEWVDQDISLKTQDRRNESGAIKWLGKIDGTPLSVIPLDIRYLVDDRYRKIRQHPDLKGRHRSGIITLLNRVLKRAGILAVGTKRCGDTSLAWISLLSSVSSDDGKTLSPLAKYCSSHADEPNQVTQETWTAFCDETLAFSTYKRPRDTIRNIIRVSNRNRLETPDWPLPELPKLENLRTISLPRTIVPESFWEDLNDYATKSVTKPKNIFDKTWPSHLREDTVDRHCAQLWRTASAQISAGRDPKTITNLAALLEMDWLERGMNWQYRRADNHFLKEHLNIAAVCISVAKRWLRDPDLAELIRDNIFDTINIELGPAEFSEKNLRKLEQFDNPEMVNAFLLLPYTIWAKVKQAKEITKAHAVEMSVAVAIELLLTTMVRRKNLVHLDLKKHFWPASPSKGKWALHLDAGEVKNAKALNFALPEHSIQLIQYYLTHCRPLLLQEPTDRLFLGEDGRPLNGQDMYHRLTTRIRKYLGLDVHPHLFRQIGTMLFLDAHPGKIGVVQVMLGHKQISTTEKFYACLKATKAIAFFTEAVLGGRSTMIKALKLV